MPRRPAILLAVAAVFTALPAFAQTGPDLLVKPFPTEIDFENTSSVLIQETGDTGNGFKVSFDQFENFGRLRLPFPEGHILRTAQASVGYEYTHFYLDTADPALPKNLTDVAVSYGMGVFQSQDETIVVGLTGGVGYAGAGGFDDGNAWYLTGNLLIGKEFTQDGRFFKDGDRFGFVLNYDGNRTLLPDWPIPGFQYTRPVTDELEIALGFPYSSILYRPTDQLEFRMRYSVPDSFTGRVDYGFNDGFGVFAEVAGQAEAFHSDTLPDGSDRLLFNQTRAELGVRYRVTERGDFLVNAILAGGYIFEQEFNVGFDVRDDDTLADLKDVPYLRAAIELRF